MKIYIPRERDPSETRAAMVPETVKKLVGLGAEVSVEPGLGTSLQVPDEAYTRGGASLEPADTGMPQADVVLRLRPPPADSVARLKRGAIHISYLDPFRRRDLVDALAAAGVSALCMELIPRSTIAQKMDALSSQASLAGYVAVILSAQRLNRIFPMMMTPSGTLAPAQVFIIGAGVAGLQAIATARRLGARVEAFDTRPVVEEQVRSLGARFVTIDIGETGQTRDGYAKALTEEQLARQRAGMARHCAAADVVITTAQVFGRRAPVIVTRDMVAGMKPGSLIVDMAVETGGNVEGAEPDREVDVNGVTILGVTNLAGRVPVHASQMYASNLGNLVEHFWDTATATFALKMDDEILKGALVTHGGRVVHEGVRKAAAGG